MPDFGIMRGFGSKLFSDKLVAGQLPTQLGLIGSENIGSIIATGGTITYSGGRTIHTFTSSGTFNVTSVPVGSTVEVLVVAGGGAGGLIYNASKSISIQAYTITVGSGGAASGGYTTQGTNGNNSIFDNLTAIGGGASGVLNINPNSGGSGGGGSAFGQSGASGTAGQGNAGGSVGGVYGGAGGGGASEVGQNSISYSQAGNGGNGTSYSISGSSTFYAGGGGGGVETGTPGTGGSGGGGTGGINSVGGSGLANTGGGGGGSWVQNSGPGGSGIVIISYPT